MHRNPRKRVPVSSGRSRDDRLRSSACSRASSKADCECPLLVHRNPRKRVPVSSGRSRDDRLRSSACSRASSKADCECPLFVHRNPRKRVPVFIFQNTVCKCAHCMLYLNYLSNGCSRIAATVLLRCVRYGKQDTIRLVHLLSG